MIFPYADENPAPTREREVALLIVFNVFCILFWGFIPALGFVPAHPVWYTWLTCLFLHGGLGHLAGNMYALWLFGYKTAYRMGRWFLPFYLAGGLFSDGVDLLLRPHSPIPSIGASGAICAVIAAYVVFFPSARMRCYTFVLNRFVQYNISALLFGAVYVGFQLYGLGHGNEGIAYSAHLGGLAFGFLAALAWPAGREAGAEGPAHVGSAGREIMALLDKGQEEAATRKFIAAVREDPLLELPAKSQYLLADKLSDLGYPLLSQWALDRLLTNEPDGAAAPYALILLGYLEQTYALDFAAALKAYRSAAAHPAATEEAKRDALARAKAAEAAAGVPFPAGAQEGDRFAVVLATGARLTDAEIKGIAAATGSEPSTSMAWATAFVDHNADKENALRLWEALRREEVPAVILPHRLVSAAPPAKSYPGLKMDPGGFIFEGPYGATFVSWQHCLFVGGALAPVGDLKRKGPGMLEVEIEGVVALGTNGLVSSGLEPERGFEAAPEPCLEVVTAEPYARHRWIPSADGLAAEKARELFEEILLEICLGAYKVPVNEAVEAAFSREIPESCAFKTLTQLDAYVHWQIQLSRLKKSRAAAGAQLSPRT